MKILEKNTTIKKELIKRLHDLSTSRSIYAIFAEVIELSAIELNNSIRNIESEIWQYRENRYCQIMKKYNKEQQLIISEIFNLIVLAFEDNPKQDFLGRVYMELCLENKRNGQFFTPYNVSVLMAKINITGKNINNIINEDGYIGITDCACGSGSLIIGAINEYKKIIELPWFNHVYFVGQELNYTTGLMCYIQLTLLGCAGYIKIGNSLSDPIGCKNDNLTNYWFTPMYFNKIWSYRRLFHNLDILMK